MATKPAMINRGQNYVVFSWKEVEELCDGTCVMEVLDELKEWAVVYWGEKKEVRIGDLAPCTCYDFRIRKEEGGEWVEFKGATLDGPYLAMHLTRAVKFGKTALIRKIAHARYINADNFNNNKEVIFLYYFLGEFYVKTHKK